MPSNVLEAPAIGRIASESGTAPAPPERRRDHPPRAPFLYAAVLGVLVIDWITPTGVVFGILLTIPILMASMMDDPGRIWRVALVAAVGFVLAALFGEGPVSPPAVWLPNWVITMLALPGSTALAVLLQRRRLAAERARDEAVAARDLTRLLMSLLAHDLRSPLTLANEGIVYVENSVSREQPIDTALLGSIRARLRRSLRALEVILTVARAEAARGDLAAAGGAAAAASTARVPARSTARVRQELVAEVAAFTHEAGERRKQLRLDFDALEDADYLVDVLVVRQALAILLDNAIRYAGPGEVHVSGRLDDGMLVVRVADPGPATGAPSSWLDGRSPRGLGIGLELCRALTHHAGGTLTVVRADATATALELRLPMERA